MTTVTMFKMPFATRHFNANQKVWVVSLTGDLAACCVGRFRGKGRYVKAWVKWGSRTKRATPPAFKDIDVADQFAQTHGL